MLDTLQLKHPNNIPHSITLIKNQELVNKTVNHYWCNPFPFYKKLLPSYIVTKKTNWDVFMFHWHLKNKNVKMLFYAYAYYVFYFCISKSLQICHFPFYIRGYMAWSYNDYEYHWFCDSLRRCVVDTLQPFIVYEMKNEHKISEFSLQRWMITWSWDKKKTTLLSMLLYNVH